MPKPTRSSRGTIRSTNNVVSLVQWRKRKVTKYPILHNRRTCNLSTGPNFDLVLSGGEIDPSEPLQLQCPFPGPTGITVYNSQVKFAEKVLNKHWADIQFLSRGFFRLSQLHSTAKDSSLVKMCDDLCKSIERLDSALASYWGLLQCAHSIRIETNFLCSPLRELPSAYAPLSALSIGKPCVVGGLVQYAQSLIESHTIPTLCARRKLLHHLEEINHVESNSQARQRRFDGLRSDLWAINNDILATQLLHSDALATLLSTKQSTYFPNNKKVTRSVWNTHAYVLKVKDDLKLPTTALAAEWGLPYLIPSTVVLDFLSAEPDNADDGTLLNNLISIPRWKLGDSKLKGTTIPVVTDRSLRRVSLMFEDYVRKCEQPMSPTLPESVASCIACSNHGHQLLSKMLLSLFSLCIQLYFKDLHTHLAEITKESVDSITLCTQLDDFELLTAFTNSNHATVSKGNEHAQTEVEGLFSVKNHRGFYFSGPHDLGLLPHTLFGARDLADVKSFCSDKIWGGKHLQKFSTSVTHQVVELLSATDKLLQRKQSDPPVVSVLRTESLQYHFIAAFLQQDYRYAAFYPHGKYFHKRVLLVDCTPTLPPLFTGNANQLSDLMDQYSKGIQFAVPPGEIPAVYNGTPLWSPIRSTGTGQSDEFHKFVGCSHELSLNSKDYPGPLTIFLARYLNHLRRVHAKGQASSLEVSAKRSKEEHVLPKESFWSQPMVASSNFMLVELYPNHKVPSRKNFEDKVKRYDAEKFKRLGIEIGWGNSPTSTTIAIIEKELSDVSTFWEAIARGVTPKTAMAWRFCRLYYDNTVTDRTRFAAIEERRKWSEQCAKAAIAVLFPPEPNTPQPAPTIEDDSSSH